MNRLAKVLSIKAISLKPLFVLSLSFCLFLSPTIYRVQAADGELDLSFGTNGNSIITFGNSLILNRIAFEPHPNSRPSVLVIQDDGKILLAGQNFYTKDLSSSDTDFSLVRCNPDGTLDGNFGSQGKITVDYAHGNDSAKALAVQPDGKILIAGNMQVSTLNNPAYQDFGIARYLNNGTIDLSFGQSGIATTDFSSRADTAFAISVLPDGRFLVAGGSSTAQKDFLALARYNSDGSLDTSFGSGGKITAEFAGKITLVRFQADGKLVVAGSISGSDFTMARYLADGSPDKAFGVDGTVTTAFSAPYTILNDVVFTPQGQIIAAGSTGSDPFFFGFGDLALVRYQADGSPDKNFGNQGVVNRDLFGLNELGEAVAIQPDGNILVTGFITPMNLRFGVDIGDYLILRFTPDGNLDPSFGDAGAVKTDFGREDRAFACGLQKDGRLVVGGYERITLIESRPSDFILARYHAYTSPDFSLALSQPSIDAVRGQTIDLDLQIQRVGGFSKPVTVTAPDLGELKIKLTSQTISTEGSSVRFTLKLKKTPVGSHQLVFTARDDSGRERPVTLTLNVRKN